MGRRSTLDEKKKVQTVNKKKIDLFSQQKKHKISINKSQYKLSGYFVILNETILVAHTDQNIDIAIEI